METNFTKKNSRCQLCRVLVKTRPKPIVGVPAAAAAKFQLSVGAGRSAATRYSPEITHFASPFRSLAGALPRQQCGSVGDIVVFEAHVIWLTAGEGIAVDKANPFFRGRKRILLIGNRWRIYQTTPTNRPAG